MKISVIIPAYDRKDFILEAVRSVFNQKLDKELYEVIVVKNFEDKTIDDYIHKLGFKNLISDSPRYGEKVSIGIEESSGEILAFLDDDDEFKQDKLNRIYKVFSSRQDISYFHDTREYTYNGRDISINNCKDHSIKGIIEALEKITPHYDVILDPLEKSSGNFLVKYHGIVATTSLMAVRRECIEDKLHLLKHIYISGENFIPAFAAECGKLYHTGERLTKYRIHSKNSSIGFSYEDQIRVLSYYLRSISDGEIIISNTSPRNPVRKVVKARLLEARYILYNSPHDIKKVLNYNQHLPSILKNILELCKIKRNFSECINLLSITLYNSLPSETLKRIIRRVRR
jgi:glycosyltransferase involved in cell wall biosynthesis